MAKFITDYLDEYSRATVHHESWGYLDCLTKEKQLDVIRNYTDKEKYIVVVFEKNDLAEKHHKRCEALGLNKEEEWRE